MTDVYDYVNSTGVIMTDTPEILAEVQAEYVGVFGAGLNLAPNTPQGFDPPLLKPRTYHQVTDNNATFLGNRINPNIPGGVYFFIYIISLISSHHSPATQSIVSCDLTKMVLHSRKGRESLIKRQLSFQ